MYRHISNPPQESLFGQEQTKGTKISELFQTILFLSFSEKGFSNIAKRFNITIDELKQHVAEHEAKEGLLDE